MGPLRQSPKRAHRSTAARAPDSRIREGGPPGSRAGRHARGELGVGMGALHLSFQGCHQPWGRAELAAGCGRYAVLNSARTTTTENGLTGKSGYPSFDGVSTTLWAPSDHWGCFLLSFEGYTKCLKNDREQWRPLQNLHRSVTLEKRIFCCRIQNQDRSLG